MKRNKLCWKAPFVPEAFREVCRLPAGSTKQPFNSVQLNVCWKVNEKYHSLLHLQHKMWGDEI